MKELTAKDLRISNNIYYKGEVVKVTMVGEYGVKCESKDYRINAKFSTPDLSPIPITEDILLKFGFTYDGDDIWVIGENLIDMGGIGAVEYDFYLIREGGVYFHGDVRVNSAHELQNLYWCLCGKELEVNL